MIKFPFTSLQQMNLDWIMQQLHKLISLIPQNGVAGDVLQRTVDGAAWQPIAAVSMDIHSLSPTAVDGADELPVYDNSLQGNYKVTVQDIIDSSPVTSVNGQTGAVVLDASDVSALPDSTVVPVNTSDLINDSGFVDAAGAAAAAPVQSVNSQTGAVTISVPSMTSDLINDSGFVDGAGAAAAAPVQSVNGMTGAVTVTGSLPVFGSPVLLTVTAPANITPNGIHVYAQTSLDGKLIRLWGHMSILRPTNVSDAGFQTFNVSGVTVAHPSVNFTQRNIALLEEEISGTVRLWYDAYGADAMRLNVDTAGTITLDVYCDHSSNVNDPAHYFLLPVIIPIA